MRLRSNLVRNILIGGSAIALSACASRAEGVPVPTLTQTPNATAWALTTPEIFQTAIIGTAIAVETKMPEEISGEIENSQHLVNINFESKYFSNGVELKSEIISTGGATIFRPININNISYVPILLSGHQVSEESKREAELKELRNKNVPIDQKDGKDQITTQLVDFAIDGEVFTNDMFEVRFGFENLKGIDWAVILIKEKNFKNKDILKNGFDSNKIFWGTPPANANYFAVSRPVIASGRSVVAVNATNHGRFYNTSYYSIGPYYTEKRSSGSGIFIEVDGIKYYFGAASGGGNAPIYVEKTNTTQIGEMMTKDQFDAMLREMAEKISK